MLKINSKNDIKSCSDEDIIELKNSLYLKLNKLEKSNTTKDPLLYLQKVYFNDSKVQKLVEDMQFSSKFFNLTLYLAQKTQNMPITLHDVFYLFDQMEKNTLIFDLKAVKTFSAFIIKYFKEFSDKLKISKEEDFLMQLNIDVYNDSKSYNYDLFYEEILPNDFEDKLKSQELKTIYQSIKKNNGEVINRVEKNKKKMRPCFPQAFKKISIFARRITKIVFEIPTTDIDVNVYLVTLMNIEWFFTGLIHIKLDMSYSCIYDNHYYIKHKHFEHNVLEGFKAYYNNTSITQIITDNTKVFEIFLFIPLFISLLENKLMAFELSLPDSFTFELKYLMKQKGIIAKRFLFITNIDKEYRTVDISFNALNSSVFERILVLINANNNIQNLRLNFFPDNEQYYSMYSLMKCLQDSSSLMNNQPIKLNSDYVIDNNELITGLLFSPFENNLEYFLYLIERKVYLFYEIELKFDLPGIFYLNDKYINTLHKFFLCFFGILSAISRPKVLRKLIIASCNFILETRKYPTINTFIQESINITNLNTIKELHLEIKFHQITAINQLIPYSIERLYLGELDSATLKSFIQGIPKLTNLKELHMTFSSLYYEFTNNTASLMNELIKCKKNDSFVYLELKILFNFNQTYYKKLIEDIKGVQKANNNEIQYCLNIYDNTQITNNTIYSKAKMNEFYALAYILKKKRISNRKLLKNLFEYLSDTLLIVIRSVKSE